MNKVGFSVKDIEELEKLTYDIGKLSMGGYIGPSYVTVTPYIVETKIYSDGETKIVVSILSDGTIHVDPAAFELMMEKMGYAEAK